MTGAAAAAWPELPPSPNPPNNCDTPSTPCARDEPGNTREARRKSAVALMNNVDRVVLIYLGTADSRLHQKTKRLACGLQENPKFESPANSRTFGCSNKIEVPKVTDLVENSHASVIELTAGEPAKLTPHLGPYTHRDVALSAESFPVVNDVEEQKPGGEVRRGGIGGSSLSARMMNPCVRRLPRRQPIRRAWLVCGT